jgi:fucose permease
MSSARLAASAMFFINGVLFATWVTRIPEVKDALGLDDSRLGLALLALGIGTFTALPLTRSLIPRWGASWATAASALACCAALPAAGAASSFAALVIVLPMFGASLGVMDVSMNAIASRLEQIEGRSIMASFHGLWSVGSLTGAGVGGAFASLEVTRLPHFAGVAIALALGVLWASRHLAEGDESSLPPPLARPQRVVLMIGLVAVCGAIVEGGIGEWSAVYMRDALGTGEGFATTGFAAFSLTMMIGRFTGDQLIDRWGRAAVLRAGGLLAAVALAVTLLAGHPLVAIAGFAIAGFGLSPVFPIAFGSAGNLGGAAPGAAIATVAAMGYGGGLTGPPLIGFVATATSLPVSLSSLVILSVLMAVLARSVAASEAPAQRRIPAPSV